MGSSATGTAKSGSRVTTTSAVGITKAVSSKNNLSQIVTKEDDDDSIMGCN